MGITTEKVRKHKNNVERFRTPRELLFVNFVLPEPSFHFAIRLDFLIGKYVKAIEVQGQSPV